MRHFERDELARRYERHRPRVHERVLGELLSLRPLRAGAVALDVGCGTGHSARALAPRVDSVVACDVSAGMLAQARRSGSQVRWVRAPAEALPFAPGSFELLTVSMALHWFESPAFLAEAARVLQQDGALWVYNLFFPGILQGDADFSAWHAARYLERYPVPERRGASLEALLAQPGAPLRFVERRGFAYEVAFSAAGLRGYLTTQSNVDAALARGESLAEIDAWLDRELAPFFAARPRRDFAYLGVGELAARTSG